MKIEELVGLRIAMAEPEEAMRFTSGDGVDLVRVANPGRQWWPVLADLGFVLKPDRVTWLADTCDDEPTFLSRLSKKEREGVAKARRNVALAKLTWREQRLDEALLASFLAVYEQAVERMKNGLPVARMHRENMLVKIERFFIVSAYDGTDLQAAAVGEWCPEVGVVRVRFSAVAGEHRAAGITRVLYLKAVEVARRTGYRRVTLGNDPNLYGHLVKPGLFAFKARLGFVPVPSTLVDPEDGEDVADQLLSMRALTDPSFMLCYPGSKSRELRFDFFSGGNDVDTRLYTACLPADVCMHWVPS